MDNDHVLNESLYENYKRNTISTYELVYLMDDAPQLGGYYHISGNLIRKCLNKQIK